MLDKVTESIFVDTSGNHGGNYGVIVQEDGIVFVDTGMVHTHLLIVKEWITKLTGLSVQKAILTHSHSDHVFGAQALGPVPIIASEETHRICKENLGERWKLEEIKAYIEPQKEERPELWDAIQTLEVKLPTLTFKNEFKLDESIHVQHVGGHTAGSSIVTWKDENVLFIGDLVFNGMFPYAGDPTANPDKWIDTLQTLAGNEYEFIIPGHGPICEVDELIRHADFLSELRDNVKHAIADGVPADEFIERGLLPEHYEEGAERRAPMSISRFYEFYGGT